MSPQTILSLMYLGSGLLFIAVALPLVQGRVPRNGWYGFRVPKTLSSDEVWYPVNRYTGRDLFHCGRVIAAGALLLLAFANRMTSDQVALIGTALTLIPLAIAIIRGFRYLSRF